MNLEVLYGSHRDPGFFVHALNTFFGGIPVFSEKLQRLEPKNVDDLSDADITLIGDFLLIVPVLNEAKFLAEGKLSLVLRPSVVSAINKGRCRLLIDYSNESGSYSLVHHINRILLSSGVNDFSRCILLCQNRLLKTQESLSIKIFFFDFFVLAAAWIAKRELSLDIKKKLIRLIAKESKPYSVLCLNATPKLHRVIALLEILDQGLVPYHGLSSNDASRSAYISFPLFTDTKNEPLDSSWLHTTLVQRGLDHLLPHLDYLEKSLPLKADALTEKGNMLATRITLDHFFRSNISIVTETGMDPNVERLTEKMIKPLAFGHPLVAIGHIHTIKQLKMLGFSAMDDFIDHSYDTITDSYQRTHRAVASAKDFLSRLANGQVFKEELAIHANHNMSWATHGFFDFYWIQYVDPIVEAVGN